MENLIKALEWMISEDDTRDIPSNAYWINGLEFARKAVAEAKGEVYTPDVWDNWSVDMLGEFDEV